MVTIDFETIVINLFNNIKPDISFDIFLSLLSDKSISWKKKEINDTIIYMFFHEWNIKNLLPISNTTNQNYITKYFNNLIIDSNYNIIMYNGPKIYDSVRDNIKLDTIVEFIESKLDECTIYEANEGTSINIFYHTYRWYFTTKRTFDMNESIYGSNNSHGLMFESIITRDDIISLLNESYTYHLTLVHSSNSHLSVIADDRLILTTIRDPSNNFKIVEDTIQHKSIFKPTLATIDNISGQDINKQGIIIHYKDIIIRLYNDIYAQTLKRKPYYGTIQEKLINSFQKNEFTTDTTEKMYTLTIINFVAIILHRILVHFTDFDTQDPKLKFKHIHPEDYHIIKAHNVIIRNLNKLQRIPFIIKQMTNVDFNQVKFHLKNHCQYKDIYQMFKIFNMVDNPIIKCINYTPPKNTQRKNQINSNIEAFANLKF